MEEKRNRVVDEEVREDKAVKREWEEGREVSHATWQGGRKV